MINSIQKGDPENLNLKDIALSKFTTPKVFSYKRKLASSVNNNIYYSDKF